VPSAGRPGQVQEPVPWIQGHRGGGGRPWAGQGLVPHPAGLLGTGENGIAWLHNRLEAVYAPSTRDLGM